MAQTNQNDTKEMQRLRRKICRAYDRKKKEKLLNLSRKMDEMQLTLFRQESIIAPKP